MAKSTEKTDTSSTKPDNGGAENQAVPEQPAQQNLQPKIDASHMTKSYANFCQVHPGPEELAIDFGFSPSNIMTPQPQSEVHVDHRIIVNYFMAKRLLGLLQASVQRYEGLFGVLETNIQKRVQPGVRTQQ